MAFSNDTIFYLFIFWSSATLALVKLPGKFCVLYRVRCHTTSASATPPRPKRRRLPSRFSVSSQLLNRVDERIRCMCVFFSPLKKILQISYETRRLSAACLSALKSFSQAGTLIAKPPTIDLVLILD